MVKYVAGMTVTHDNGQYPRDIEEVTDTVFTVVAIDGEYLRVTWVEDGATKWDHMHADEVTPVRWEVSVDTGSDLSSGVYPTHEDAIVAARAVGTALQESYDTEEPLTVVLDSPVGGFIRTGRVLWSDGLTEADIRIAPVLDPWQALIPCPW